MSVKGVLPRSDEVRNQIGISFIIQTIIAASQERKLLWIVAREANGSIEPRAGEPYSFVGLAPIGASTYGAISMTAHETST